MRLPPAPQHGGYPGPMLRFRAIPAGAAPRRTGSAPGRSTVASGCGAVPVSRHRVFLTAVRV